MKLAFVLSCLYLDHFSIGTFHWLVWSTPSMLIMCFMSLSTKYLVQQYPDCVHLVCTLFLIVLFWLLRFHPPWFHFLPFLCLLIRFPHYHHHYISPMLLSVFWICFYTVTYCKFTEPFCHPENKLVRCRKETMQICGKNLSSEKVLQSTWFLLQWQLLGSMKGAPIFWESTGFIF